MTVELPNFQDTSQWVCYPKRVVWEEHEIKDQKGKVIKRYGRKELDEIAAENNLKDSKGALIPLSLGHTIPGAPETQQPELVGYARNYAVEFSSELGKNVIVADYYVRRDKDEKAKEYPRVSVEYWPERKQFDPIALLKRTPNLDLPQWTYERRGKQQVVRYSREAADMPEKKDGELLRGGEPAEEKTGAGTYDELKPHMDRYMRECYPHLAAMHEEHSRKYAAGAAGASVPSGSNTDMPSLLKAENPTRMAADGIPEKYARELDGLRKEMDTLRTARAMAEADVLVSRLEHDGYQFADRNKEVIRFARMSSDERKERETEVRQHYRREEDPTRYGMVPVAQDSLLRATDESEPITKDQMHAALKYQREKGCGYEEALQYARKTPRTTVADREWAGIRRAG